MTKLHDLFNEAFEECDFKKFLEKKWEERKEIVKQWNQILKKKMDSTLGGEDILQDEGFSRSKGFLLISVISKNYCIIELLEGNIRVEPSEKERLYYNLNEAKALTIFKHILGNQKEIRNKSKNKNVGYDENLDGVFYGQKFLYGLGSLNLVNTFYGVMALAKFGGGNLFASTDRHLQSYYGYEDMRWYSDKQSAQTGFYNLFKEFVSDEDRDFENVKENFLIPNFWEEKKITI